MTRPAIPAKKQTVCNISDKQWLDPKELQQPYGFGISTQAKMRMASNHSKLLFSKIGKYIRYDRNEINEWLREHQVQGLID